MSIPIRTAKEIDKIVSNLVDACEDIRKLSKVGYSFIYQCGYFIAHYDLNGFRDYYLANSLRDDILRFQDGNQYTNFRTGEPNAAYYHQKREIYNRIVQEITSEDFDRPKDYVVNIPVIVGCTYRCKARNKDHARRLAAMDNQKAMLEILQQHVNPEFQPTSVVADEAKAEVMINVPAAGKGVVEALIAKDPVF